MGSFGRSTAVSGHEAASGRNKTKSGKLGHAPYRIAHVLLSEDPFQTLD